MSDRAVRITKRNSTFQVLHRLASNRQKRSSTRTFLVEGVVPINRALAHGWAFAALMHAGAAALSTWAMDVVSRAHAETIYELSPELLGELSGKDEPSEIIGLLRMPADDLGRVPIRPDLLVAVADRPASPGNLGTLIRSCDAFGVHGLIVSGHAADVYDPATVTASRGSLFAVPVVRVESHARVTAWVGSVRRTLGTCQVVGADETASTDIAGCDFSAATVAIFGNEAHGLSHAYQQLCDRLTRIPMVGSATSLNVGVAASIVFYEALRQRRARVGPEQGSGSPPR